MTAGCFIKHYETPARVTAAVRHHAWIAEHASPLRQPAVTAVGSTSVTFERVEGRPARPEDLPLLAELLGDAHGAAWTSDLRSAPLTAPHHFQDGTTLDGYLGPRQAALQRRLEQGYLPDEFALHGMLTLLEKTAEGPTSFYKDSNPRNFLITETGAVYTVDTDDLTLAPLAYDLAKLIVTLIATYGPLSEGAVDEALATYNRAAACHDVRLGATGRERLDDFVALHAVLTAPYAGLNGYQHGWLPGIHRPRGSA
ncbi:MULTISPECIES: phosphotransferase [Streptomyces]|uniref:Phosphotransferase n=1 Tax=Streptomyces venezuelae TaxID=54571 RepID=A0A5P2AP73_STRVZ|nr:phosphotransferase [Streptomyces venezuelae]QES18661.1 phosphotransferase [Streptomyces venezuelae]